MGRPIGGQVLRGELGHLAAAVATAATAGLLLAAVAQPLGHGRALHGVRLLLLRLDARRQGQWGAVRSRRPASSTSAPQGSGARTRGPPRRAGPGSHSGGSLP